MIYVVQEGDTLYSIAERFGESAFRIGYDNQIGERALVEGESLLILIPDILHEVKEGETLYSISLTYEVSVREIYRRNPYLLLQAAPTYVPKEYSYTKENQNVSGNYNWSIQICLSSYYEKRRGKIY